MKSETSASEAPSESAGVRLSNDPPESSGPQAGGVPTYLSSFVGRSQELAQLKQLLGQDGPRLLTLTGPGGVGKTRLAAQAAVDVQDDFEDGVCWVALDGLTDPGQLPGAVVAALGLAETASPSTGLLSRSLALRHLLLVLDNCEHLLSATAQLAHLLLRDAPDVRILATSRQRLNVSGERAWLVPGMAVPEATETIAGDDGAAVRSQLLTYDAVSLFVERAASIRPQFQLTEETGPSVIEICRQVDGIPLAVELAASRCYSLGVDQIAARLRERLDLLSGGQRSAPTRQQTLRATFDWSHELLSEPEKVLFRRLAVFQGRFTLEAAEAVCAFTLVDSADPVASIAPEAVLDLLSTLADKSLVTVERPQGDQAFFRLLDMIRRYAQEKLAAAGEAEAARKTHLAFYSDLVSAARAGLQGPDQRAWVRQLAMAQDNVRAALRWAITRARAATNTSYRRTAQAMANTLFWYWGPTDMFSEGRDWLEQTLALFQPRPVEPLVAEGLGAAGSMAWLMGDMDTAQHWLEESLAQWQRLEEGRGIGFATMMLGRVHLYRGQAQQAVELARQSDALFRQIGASHELGLNLGLLSAGLAMVGEFGAAYAAAQECRDIFKEIGDPFFLGMALGDLGWAAYHDGQLQKANDHLLEALALRREIGSDWQTAQALVYLAEIARLQGAHREAITFLEESLALAEELGAESWRAHSARHLGLVASAQGRWSEAAAYLLDSLARCERIGHEAGMVMAVEGLAAVAAAGQDQDLAGLLFGAAEAKRAEIGAPRAPAERVDLERLATRLEPWFGDDRFAAGRAAGRELSLPEAGRRAEPLAMLFQAQPLEVGPGLQRLQIYALGPTRVVLDGRELVAADWSYAKPKELFFYLVSNRALAKEQIGQDFWPDASPDQLRRNFRATLYHLRQALSGREWVLFDKGRYSFNRSLDFWYDVETFEAHIAAGRQAAGEQEQALEALAAASSLYRGAFVEDLALDGWALVQRESLRQQYLDAQSTRASLLAAGGQLQEAAGVYLELLDHDNLLESAHRGLMRCYARLGQRGRALRHYQELVELLADELGVEPSEKTVALYHWLQQGQEL